MALTRVNSKLLGGTFSSDTSGNLNIDSGTFYVDASNNRVGVGTTSPTNTLDINGTTIFRFSGTQFGAVFNDSSSLNLQAGSGSSAGFKIGTSAATPLSFYTNGGSNERMRITSNGDVGIGSNNPTGIGSGYKNLVVAGGAGGNLDLSDSSGTVRATISTDNSGGNALFIDTRTSHPIIFRTTSGSTERVRITSAGSVGIGVSSPSYTLDISGGFRSSVTGGSIYTSSAGGIPRLNVGGGNGFGFNRQTTTEDMFFGEPGDTGTWRVRGAGTISLGVGNSATTMTIAGNGGNVGIGTTNPSEALEISRTENPKIRFVDVGNLDAKVGIVGSTALGFEVFGSERMRIDSSGNVGIGISSPASYNAQLVNYKTTGVATYLGHSNGGTFPKVSALSFGSDAVAFTHTSGGSTFALTGSAQIAAIQSASSDAPTAMAFYTTAGGNVAERMRIDSSGNVGIGFSSPSYKLQVNGSIYTNTYAFIGGFGTGGSNAGLILDYSGVVQWQIYPQTTTGVLAISSGGAVRLQVGTAGQIGISGANYGTSGQVLTSGGSGSAPSWTSVSGLGSGQTWTNVGGSRSSGTTYTNSTGKPIQVMVATDNTGNTTYDSGGAAKFYINGSNVGQAFCSNAANVGGLFQAVIPDGSTYSVSANTIRSWWELR